MKNIKIKNDISSADKNTRLQEFSLVDSAGNYTNYYYTCKLKNGGKIHVHQ